MPRYIDADVLIKRLYGMPVYRLTVLDVMHLVDDSPTADVVEVVRCKDCKHNPNNTDDDFCPFVLASGGCVKHFPSDFFCADGERREDEN